MDQLVSAVLGTGLIGIDRFKSPANHGLLHGRYADWHCIFHTCIGIFARLAWQILSRFTAISQDSAFQLISLLTGRRKLPHRRPVTGFRAAEKEGTFYNPPVKG